MQTNLDPWTGVGVIALDRGELQRIRGGIGIFWMGLICSAIVALVNDADKFVQGVKEGYAWARS